MPYHSCNIRGIMVLLWCYYGVTIDLPNDLGARYASILNTYWRCNNRTRIHRAEGSQNVRRMFAECSLFWYYIRRYLRVMIIGIILGGLYRIFTGYIVYLRVMFFILYYIRRIISYSYGLFPDYIVYLRVMFFILYYIRRIISYLRVMSYSYGLFPPIYEWIISIISYL